MMGKRIGILLGFRIHKLDNMKYFFITTVFCLYSLISCTQNKVSNQAAIDATFSKISSGQIGNIKVGDKLEIVLENLSKKFLVEKDSVEACPGCKEYLDIYYISNPQTHSLLFSLEPQSDSINGSKIFRMVTSNSAFKTENGIAVGVTLKELKYNYKIVDIVADGETGLHILVKGFKGSFGVEWPNNIEIDNINLQTLSDSLKINEIIIM